MKVLAIDPGNMQSAFIVYDTDTKEVGEDMIVANEHIIVSDGLDVLLDDCDRMAIEMVACYGMPVGKTVFDTCVWVGRYIERWLQHSKWTPALVYRMQVKMHLCKHPRAKDGNIRQAIIDRYPAIGGGKIPQIGIKDKPGPLFGISKDIWSALAVAITYAETILC